MIWDRYSTTRLSHHMKRGRAEGELRCHMRTYTNFCTASTHTCLRARTHTHKLMHTNARTNARARPHTHTHLSLLHSHPLTHSQHPSTTHSQKPLPLSHHVHRTLSLTYSHPTTSPPPQNPPTHSQPSSLTHTPDTKPSPTATLAPAAAWAQILKSQLHCAIV